VTPAIPGLPWDAGLDGAANGANHPVSLWFWTLDHAHELYLHARALSDELGWCALLAAVHSAKAHTGAQVYASNTGWPYILNRPLTVNPNRVTVRSRCCVPGSNTPDYNGCAIPLAVDAASAAIHECYAICRRLLPCGRLYSVETRMASATAPKCARSGVIAPVRVGSITYPFGTALFASTRSAACMIASRWPLVLRGCLFNVYRPNPRRSRSDMTLLVVR
jgi:hypothetical protein